MREIIGFLALMITLHRGGSRAPINSGDAPFSSFVNMRIKLINNFEFSKCRHQAHSSIKVFKFAESICICDVTYSLGQDKYENLDSMPRKRPERKLTLIRVPPAIIYE